MAIKTPIRTVFDSSNNATGLAEFQTGEAVGTAHGGTGLTAIGTAGQFLKVNSTANGLEWAAVNEENLSDNTTDDLAEGSTNLYYTNARWDARLATKDTGNVSEGSNLYYTNARADARIALQVGTNLDISNQDTDDLSEGSTNLYFTNSRADARISNAIVDEDDMVSNSATQIPSQQSVKAYVDSQVASKDQLSELTGSTDDVTEGSTNLYFTTARARGSISATGSLSYNSTTGAISFTQGNTDTVSEGSTNLYYTDARVASYLSTNNYATQSYVTTQVNNILDGAPTGLDTLNELAAALNDDENFYSSITPTSRAAISVTGSGLSYNNSTGVINFSLPANTATTDDAIALSIALG
jgi:hypothetical protein